MIIILLMLPTKLVNVIQYGGSVKSISLLPFWGNKLMKQVIYGEDFGPDLFQIYIQPGKGSWRRTVN
jgi:hypothetical protein